MGIRNYLIEGVSGTGKTTVAEELQRRGHHVIHGDRELICRMDPETGEPLKEPVHASERDRVFWYNKHHFWNVGKVRSIVADNSVPITFFCGASRNFFSFIDLFDEVFILEVDDIYELFRRMDERVARDPTDFGGKPEEKEIVAQLHKTKEDIPNSGIIIDASAPLEQVVNEILERCA